MPIENLKLWNLANDEVGDEIQGQFQAEDLRENGVGSVWAEHTVLNRSRAVQHFIHGMTPQIQFTSRFYAQDISQDVYPVWSKLKSWSQVNPDLGRPPILQFWVGDAHIVFKQCFLEELGDIVYEEPRSDGSLRHVKFMVKLREYTPFNLETKTSGETRYHKAASSETYEMLCLREYNNQMLGDVIRKRHPTKPNIQVGDVIKLPTLATLRKEVVEPKSIALNTAYGKGESPQRSLRLEMFDLRNRVAISHIIKE